MGSGMARIMIIPHQAAWASQFRMAAEALLPLCPPGATIHHIGSTAIPGLSAKDVIDIQISVPRLEDFPPAGLTAAGYTDRGLAEDHAPAGMHLSAPNLQKRYFSRTSPALHVHVRERGRFNQSFALLCRDFLRASPHAVAAYEAVKQELAARFPTDKAAYNAVKNPVFDLIMAGAREWAARTGWTPPDA
jgi:GrpB-like predicted nucleotidyltransferase (UPF0157 family)